MKHIGLEHEKLRVLKRNFQLFKIMFIIYFKYYTSLNLAIFYAHCWQIVFTLFIVDGCTTK